MSVSKVYECYLWPLALHHADLTFYPATEMPNPDYAHIQRLTFVVYLI